MPVPQVRTDINVLTDFRGRRAARENVLAGTMLKKAQTQNILSMTPEARAAKLRREQQDRDVAWIEKLNTATPALKKELMKVRSDITIESVGPNTVYRDETNNFEAEGPSNVVNELIGAYTKNREMFSMDPATRTGEAGTAADKAIRIFLMNGGKLKRLRPTKQTPKEIKAEAKARAAGTAAGTPAKKVIPLTRIEAEAAAKVRGTAAGKSEEADEFLKDKAKLVDDTRAFYKDKARHLLDPDTGLVRFGPEGDEDKHIKEYNEIFKEMSGDMIKIRKGDLPSWLEGEVEKPTMPDPATNTGRIIKDTETGERFQSNGTEWIKL